MSANYRLTGGFAGTISQALFPEFLIPNFCTSTVYATPATWGVRSCPEIGSWEMTVMVALPGLTPPGSKGHYDTVGDRKLGKLDWLTDSPCGMRQDLRLEEPAIQNP